MITLAQLRDYVIYTKHDPYSPALFLLKWIEEAGELGEEWLLNRRMEGDGIKGTLEEELWDVLCYLVHVALATGVDLPRAMVLREEHNAARFQRPGIRAFFGPRAEHPEELGLDEIQQYVRAVPHPQAKPEADYIHLIKEIGLASQAYIRSSEHGMAAYRLAAAGGIDGTLEARLWDAMFYLLRMANAAGADMEQCAIIKEKYNARRFGRMGIDEFIACQGIPKDRSSRDGQ